MTGEGQQPLSTQQPYLFAKSEFFGRPLPTEAIVTLVEHFLPGRASGESRELDFMPWGGAYNRVRPDATAFVHREELFQIKHSVSVDPEGSKEKADAQSWVARSWRRCIHDLGGVPELHRPDLEGGQRPIMVRTTTV
jgi:hypothetical protein